MTMKRAKLILSKRRRHIWETTHEGQYIDFYRLPSDGLWRTSYFGERQVFPTLKAARTVVEAELTEKARWIANQGAA